MNSTNQKKELEQRLKKFALDCAFVVIKLPKNDLNRIYGRQLIRSSSSVGANYAEANCALTRKDFAHDINKCRKEAKESYYWIELLIEINPHAQELQKVLQEANELLRIFQKSAATLRNKK